MADKQRQEQIAESIRAKAGVFFSSEPPAGTLATVTEVSMSPDLNYADIHISILPADKSEEALKQAEKALPGLRRRIGNELKLRRVPELRVYHDDRAEARARVEEILGDIDANEDESELSS